MYDIICIGAGASGIFLALSLLEKNANLKILILDKGKALTDRNRKKGADVVEGFGGAGSFSDGKLVMSIEREYGGNLQDYIHDLNLFQTLMNKVDETYMRFSDKKDIRVYGDADRDIEKIKMRAGRAGLHLLSARIRHLGTDNNYEILKNMFVYLQNKVDIRFLSEVCFIEPKDRGFTVGIRDLANNNEYQASSKYCVLAPGRRGMKFFKKVAKDLGLPLINNQVDIGVRVEFWSHVMDIVITMTVRKLQIRTMPCLFQPNLHNLSMTLLGTARQWQGSAML
ncbi:MAG: hypothetical protein HYS98_04290 [Deltaproteobacteria bacterium]|nr:hypothetical protein [Deltaproteobacteria bacterium]